MEEYLLIDSHRFGSSFVDSLDRVVEKEDEDDRDGLFDVVLHFLVGGVLFNDKVLGHEEVADEEGEQGDGEDKVDVVVLSSNYYILLAYLLAHQGRRACH